MRSELLPIPGSPPSRTSEPRTMPPPRTRSNSPIPVGIRCSASAGTSFRATAARGARETPPALGGATTRSSTSVFQLEQDGHRPIHLGAWKPQLWQTKETLEIEGTDAD